MMIHSRTLRASTALWLVLSAAAIGQVAEPTTESPAAPPAAWYVPQEITDSPAWAQKLFDVTQKIAHAPRGEPKLLCKQLADAWQLEPGSGDAGTIDRLKVTQVLDATTVRGTLVWRFVPYQNRAGGTAQLTKEEPQPKQDN